MMLIPLIVITPELISQNHKNKLVSVVLSDSLAPTILVTLPFNAPKLFKTLLSLYAKLTLPKVISPLKSFS